MKKRLILLISIMFPLLASAKSWNWEWIAAAGDPLPTIEITPLKYGKRWAYAIEIDDGPASTLTVSQPLLARYRWNDAPPGVPEGVYRPYVGTAAVVVGGIGRNSKSLSLEDLAKLKEHGWNIVNHSYWHTGVHWDKSKMNTPEQFRRELYWSQSVLAELVGNGRAPTHFVYPNGDYNYGPYLHEFGLLTGSRTSGSSPRNLLDPKLNLLNFTRNYLDTKPWAAKNDALHGLPEKPELGDFIIDFTHGMNPDPDSINNKLWVARLDYIDRNWGPKGDNSMWVAPSDEVFEYFLAAREARATVAANSIGVEIPDSAPGAALTLKISGLSDRSLLKAPSGGTLYRHGNTAWLTTPMIGESGTPAPSPRLRRIYFGEVRNLSWDKPVAVAGIRVWHEGRQAEGDVTVEIIKADGDAETLLSIDQETLAKTWGPVLHFIVPDQPAVPCKELRIPAEKSLKQMEIWAEE